MRIRNGEGGHRLASLGLVISFVVYNKGRFLGALGSGDGA